MLPNGSEPGDLSAEAAPAIEMGADATARVWLWHISAQCIGWVDKSWKATVLGIARQFDRNRRLVLLVGWGRGVEVMLTWPWISLAPLVVCFSLSFCVTLLPQR